MAKGVFILYVCLSLFDYFETRSQSYRTTLFKNGYKTFFFLLKSDFTLDIALASNIKLIAKKSKVNFMDISTLPLR